MTGELRSTADVEELASQIEICISVIGSAICPMEQLWCDCRKPTYETKAFRRVCLAKRLTLDALFQRAYTPSEIKAQRIPNTMLRYVSQYKTIGHSTFAPRESLELLVTNLSIDSSSPCLLRAGERNGDATRI